MTSKEAAIATAKQLMAMEFHWRPDSPRLKGFAWCVKQSIEGEDEETMSVLEAPNSDPGMMMFSDMEGNSINLHEIKLDPGESMRIVGRIIISDMQILLEGEVSPLGGGT